MRRYDAARLANVERTPQGGLKVQGTLTKTGIFNYRRQDGSVRREYRPPSEVFSQSHLDSFKGAPVTIGHPGEVTPSTWKKVAVGHVGDDVRQDDIYAKGTLYIQDSEAIKAIEGGKLVELSLGYEVDLDETPGRTDAGEEYDAVQRNIRGNHVAMGPMGWGRAGRDVAMRLDSAGDELVETANDESLHTNKDMSESNTPVPAVAPAVEVRVDSAAVERLSAEKAVLQAKVEELQAALADTARFDAAVEERVALVTIAKDLKLDVAGKSNRDIKAAVVEAKNPKLKLDSKASDEFINAAYSIALTWESAPEPPHPSLGQVRKDAAEAAPSVDIVTAAAKKNVSNSLNAWKTSNRDALLGRS